MTWRYTSGSVWVCMCGNSGVDSRCASCMADLWSGIDSFATAARATAEIIHEEFAIARATGDAVSELDALERRILARLV